MKVQHSFLPILYNPSFHLKMLMFSVELSYVYYFEKSFTLTKYCTCTYKTEMYFCECCLFLHTRHPFVFDIPLSWSYPLSVYMFIGIPGVIGLSQTQLPKEAILNRCTINKQLVTGYKSNLSVPTI